VISAGRAHARAAGQFVVRQQSIGRRHHGWENKCQNLCKDTWHAMHGLGRRPNECSSGLAKAGFNGTMTAPRLLTHARRVNVLMCSCIIVLMSSCVLMYSCLMYYCMYYT
jgi:hypothetical protein